MNNIILAKNKDIFEIVKLYDLCNQFLLSKKLFHWNGYWVEEIIKEKIKNKELFIYISNNKIEGSIVISKSTPHNYPFYKNSLYISGLAVNPKSHFLGIGSSLLLFSENKALNDNLNNIFLDYLSSYKNLEFFYLNRGYKKLKELKGKKFSYTIMTKNIKDKY